VPPERLLKDTEENRKKANELVLASKKKSNAKKGGTKRKRDPGLQLTVLIMALRAFHLYLRLCFQSKRTKAWTRPSSLRQSDWRDRK